MLNPGATGGQLNFVSTADIGGGDYGSATVNQRGELVGVTFDGHHSADVAGFRGALFFHPRDGENPRWHKVVYWD